VGASPTPSLDNAVVWCPWNGLIQACWMNQCLETGIFGHFWAICFTIIHYRGHRWPPNPWGSCVGPLGWWPPNPSATQPNRWPVWNFSRRGARMAPHGWKLEKLVKEMKEKCTHHLNNSKHLTVNWSIWFRQLQINIIGWTRAHRMHKFTSIHDAYCKFTICNCAVSLV